MARTARTSYLVVPSQSETIKISSCFFLCPNVQNTVVEATFHPANAIGCVLSVRPKLYRLLSACLCVWDRYVGRAAVTPIGVKLCMILEIWVSDRSSPLLGTVPKTDPQNPKFWPSKSEYLEIAKLQR